MRAAYLATWPVRQASAAHRWFTKSWPSLGRPCISVGNLAFGGRGKTPMTAMLAIEAASRGLGVAILTRGYKSRVGRASDPILLSAVGEGDVPWKRHLSDGTRIGPATSFSALCGDEATWLAATCGQVTVAIHPDRSMAASVALRHTPIDLFLLDDGFQTKVQRDLDLVLVDPSQDPPFEQRAACREGSASLRRVDQLALIYREGIGNGGEHFGHPVLRRSPRLIRALSTGEIIRPERCPPVVVAAAVAEPSSVSACAREHGLTVTESIAIRDHGSPSWPQRRRMSRRSGHAVLITEKDALGWAASSPPEGTQTLVLSMELEGSQAIARLLLDRLEELHLLV